MKCFRPQILVAKRMVIIGIYLITMNGCAPPEVANVEHKGLIDCFRLDREPVDDQGCGNDLGGGNLARPNQGNYHRNLDQPMTSNILIANMPQAHLDKLPVSDCLWTAGSQDGNGDRVLLFWDSWFELGFPESPGINSSLHSVCRFDPPFKRISKFDELGEGGLNTACLKSLGTESNSEINTHGNKLDETNIKSTCDMDIYGLPLVEHTKSDNIYSQCLPFNEAALNSFMGNRVGVDVDLMLTGFRAGLNQVSGCGPIEDEGLISIKPSGDAIFSVGDTAIPGTNIPVPELRSLLYPQIMTVIDQRSIARPLQATSNNEYFWQGEVLILGDAGEQKWLENFSENIRVDKVRVFEATHPVDDVRNYIDLNGAVINVFDADDEVPGTAVSCPSDDGTVFDVVACQFSATPTYQIDHLVNTNITSLSDPLIWQIELSTEVEGDLYIEFDLVSTYESIEAAILAEPGYLGLGSSLVGESSNQIIQVTNVGNGPYLIDQVGIDLNYGQSFVFSAERLDDPVMIPYPFYLEPTGNDNEYTTGFQDLSTIETHFDIREFEDHSTVRHRYQENTELEVESEPVTLQGHVAVAQSQNPTFDGSLRQVNRIYPFRYPVYQVWNLPYLLKPGEQRSVMVSSHPPYVGEFKGKLDVSGYPFHDPSARSTVSVFIDSYGLTGPIVDILPRSLSFPHHNGGANELNVVVVNTGDSTLIRGELLVTDSTHVMHVGEAQNFKITTNPEPPVINNISVGDSEFIQIKYDPGCFPILPTGGYHRAVLSIKTDVGDYVVPLAGDPIRSVANDPACQPGG